MPDEIGSNLQIKLGDLKDVERGAPEDGDTIVFDGATGMWMPGAVAAGGGGGGGLDEIFISAGSMTTGGGSWIIGSYQQASDSVVTDGGGSAVTPPMLIPSGWNEIEISMYWDGGDTSAAVTWQFGYEMTTPGEVVAAFSSQVATYTTGDINVTPTEATALIKTILVESQAVTPGDMLRMAIGRPNSDPNSGNAWVFGLLLRKLS